MFFFGEKTSVGPNVVVRCACRVKDTPHKNRKNDTGTLLGVFVAETRKKMTRMVMVK